VPHSLARSFTAAALGLSIAIHAAHAQERASPPDLSGIVKDEGWARILGKALFWDTVASVKGADCGSCHFVTGANREIPDQSTAPLQMRRTAIEDLTAQPGIDTVVDRGSLVDVCSRSISAPPAELADSGPAHSVTRVAAQDPSCTEDVTARLAHGLLEHKPLEARSINPDDGTFGPSGPHGNLVSPAGRGLDRTYQWMIEQAFEEPLWRAAEGAVAASDNPLASAFGPHSRVEQNFQLFWGIAVMVYESTLDPRWRHDHEVARSLPLPVASNAARADWE
jgi:hypothetical protein